MLQHRSCRTEHFGIEHDVSTVLEYQFGIFYAVRFNDRGGNPCNRAGRPGQDRAVAVDQNTQLLDSTRFALVGFGVSRS